MLPKRRRLDRKSLNLVLRTGQFKQFGPLVLKYRLFPNTPNTPAVKPRFGAVIPVAVFKKSPDRHLWKRRIYDIAAAWSKSQDLNVWLVVMVKKGVNNWSFSQLRQNLESCFNQLKL